MPAHPAELEAEVMQVRMHESMPEVLTAAEEVVELWAETAPATAARTRAVLDNMASVDEGLKVRRRGLRCRAGKKAVFYSVQAACHADRRDETIHVQPTS